MGLQRNGAAVDHPVRVALGDGAAAMGNAIQKTVANSKITNLKNSDCIDHFLFLICTETCLRTSRRLMPLLLQNQIHGHTGHRLQ